MRLSLRSLLPALAVASALAGVVPARADGVLRNALNPHCPKCYHCFEGPPKIKFKPGCPRPCCEPCNMPHYGYFPTCWSPWPFPPDWSHCQIPPTTAMVPPHPGKMPVADVPRDSRQRLPEVDDPQAPAPRLLDNMSWVTPYYRYPR